MTPCNVQLAGDIVNFVQMSAGVVEAWSAALPSPANSPHIPADLRTQALDTVLHSARFKKNPRLSALLKYLCWQSASESGEPPKEYSIATDVFDRGPEFDSSTDSIVRVEMHRLRKKLKEFYSEEGRGEPWQIVLEAGCYRPRFLHVAAPPVREQVAVAAPGSAPPPIGTSARWPLYVLLVVLLAGGVWAVASRRVVEPNPMGAALADTRGAVRILCGVAADEVPEVLQNEWGADRYYSGGTPIRAVKHSSVGRTRNPDLYRSARSGNFRYDIPLRPGSYELRLHFAETRQSKEFDEGVENVRVFDVFANGTRLLEAFDIASDSGPGMADVKVFRDVQPSRDGKLHLTFGRVVDEPLLNAIEIAPGDPARLRPVRFITQTAPMIDASGQRWSPDDFFAQGRTRFHGGNNKDVAITDSERYGHFSYAIPVAAGRYTARLHFVEEYWGPDLPGGGGAGSRLFDVYCNGQALWRSLDVFVEAGGSRRELVKTAEGLEPNAQGKIEFSFVPVKNYATVSALEVIDEAGTAIMAPPSDR